MVVKRFSHFTVVLLLERLKTVLDYIQIFEKGSKSHLISLIAELPVYRINIFKVTSSRYWLALSLTCKNLTVIGSILNWIWSRNGAVD